MQVNFKGTETVFTPEQIYGMFMSHLKSTAENNLHKPVVDVVVSVCYVCACYDNFC